MNSIPRPLFAAESEALGSGGGSKGGPPGIPLTGRKGLRRQLDGYRVENPSPEFSKRDMTESSAPLTPPGT